MTTTDRPTTDQAMPLAAAAAQLGVSREAVRLRIRRGTLRGERRADGWVVYLADAPPGRSSRPATDQSDRPTRRPTREAQQRIAWLEARIEAGEAERAELRRMLYLEQQTVAGLRAQLALLPPPSPQDGAETASTPEGGPIRRRPWWAPWRW